MTLTDKIVKSKLIWFLPFILLIIPFFYIEKTEPQFGGDLTALTAEKTLVDTLKSAQETAKTADGKYMTVESTTDKTTGYKYWVDEYVAPECRSCLNPKLYKGYQIHFEKTDGSTMSTGTGILAKELSHDWIAKPIVISTSTEEIIK